MKTDAAFWLKAWALHASDIDAARGEAAWARRMSFARLADFLEHEGLVFA